LTEEEKQEVTELQKRDREVRAHEQAHIAAGGQYITGGASFEYETGPNGRRYAVGGEVSIDTSEVKGDPEATIQKMRVVRKAALAPAKPSAKDRSVAATASQKEAEARQELAKQKREEAKQQGNESDFSIAAYGESITSSYSSSGTKSTSSLIPSTMNILA
jgi:hypothetical protein